MNILCVGPLWRGSNAGGLFRALGRQGCLIEIIDEFYYVSLRSKNKVTKLLERAIRQRQVNEYNSVILKQVDIFKPDVVLIYKGVFVLPDTLRVIKAKRIKIICFYPDVSTSAHGGHIPVAMPLYDLVFTTKTFGIKDMELSYGVKDAVFIPHGFDPEIHRALPDVNKRIFACDISFIGTWSPNKEKLLTFLKESLPLINLKIWGGRWENVSNSVLKSSIQNTEILGDLYTLALQASTINLGMLSEQVSGASSGDRITSRTFHIPGSSGFMLHERNEESVLYYKEDEEAVFFDGAEEMVAKVQKYLADTALRERIRMAGYKRALRDHSLDERAKVVLGHIEKLTNQH